jgi:hypothetical protein
MSKLQDLIERIVEAKVQSTVEARFKAKDVNPTKQKSYEVPPMRGMKKPNKQKESKDRLNRAMQRWGK